MIHSQAAEIAIKVHDELKPFCEKICIAGSVRRGKPEVHDIELVCMPKLDPDANIFQSPYGLLDYLHNPTGFLASAKRLKGQDRYQQWQSMNPEIKLDLFIVLPPAQWGVILAIRTGPRELSQLLVTHKKYGGFLPSNARVQDGVVRIGSDVLDMVDEASFMQFCGLPNLLPGQRDEFVEHYNQVRLRINFRPGRP